MTYKYSKRIIITLESNNVLKLQELDIKYFLTRPSKVENNPNDEANYVAISRISAGVEILKKEGDKGDINKSKVH